MIKPSVDNSDYELIKLKNGLEVIFNYDNQEVTSTVSLVVNTGYFNDPDEYQGLSHFLEHMIFMGSKKYPSTDLFHSLIAQYNGEYNGITSDENTIYYYTITTSGKSDKNSDEKSDRSFLHMLDVFSSFFISPLFKESTVLSEIKIINSEYDTRYSAFRNTLYPIEGSICDNSHPLEKLGCGNSKTLYGDSDKQKNIINNLRDYYKKYYYAENMKVCVRTNLDKELIKEKIVKYFSKIRSGYIQKDVKEYLPFNNLLSHISKPLILYNQDSKEYLLDIIFQTSSVRKLYNIKPDYIISHLIGHESKGSIVYHLKQKKYITDMYVSCTNNYLSGQLTISVSLVNSKYASYVYNSILNYINFLKSSLTFENCSDIYKELSIISRVQFNSNTYSDKTSKTTNMAVAMQYYPYAYVLYNEYYYSDYSRDVYNTIINYLTTLTHPLIFVSVMEKLPRKTKYYNMNYDIKQYEEKNLEIVFSFPIKNPYIKQLVLNDKNSFMKEPVLINNVWYQIDTRKKINDSRVNILIYSVVTGNILKTELIASIYSNIIRELIRDQLYFMEMAGFKVNITSYNCGIIISANGWYFPLNIIKYILSCLNMKLTENVFNYVIKTKLNKIEYNKNSMSVIDQLMNISYFVDDVNYPLPENIINELKEIKYNDVIEFQKSLITNSFKSYIYGEVDEKLANTINNLILQYITNNVNHIKVPSFNRNNLSTYSIAPYNINEHNNAISVNYYITNDYDDYKTILYANIFCKLANDLFFSELRTQQGFGYTVGVVPKICIDEVNYLYFINFFIVTGQNMIDSASDAINSFCKNLQFDTDELSVFLTDDQDIISNKKFNELVSAFTTVLNPINEDNEIIYSRNWKQIMLSRNKFNINNLMSECLKSLTYNDFVNFVREKIINKRNDYIVMIR